MDLDTICDILSILQNNSDHIAVSEIVKKYSENPNIGYLMNSKFIFRRDFCFGLKAVMGALFGASIADELPIIFTPNSGCKHEMSCFHCRSCRPCLYDFDKYLLLTSLVDIRDVRKLIFDVYSK